MQATGGRLLVEDGAPSGLALYGSNDGGQNWTRVASLDVISTARNYGGGAHDVFGAAPVGSHVYRFVAKVNVSKPFRYLAFWGEGSVDTPQGPSFQEIELTLASSLNGLNEIKYGINDGGITFHDTTTWTYAASNMKDFSTIMNGQKSLTPNRHQYKDLPGSVVVWYMDLGSNVSASVSGGAYWTYANDDWFPSGKLYGTNTDPSTFSDASLISNYDFICDLTRNGASPSVPQIGDVSAYLADGTELVFPASELTFLKPLASAATGAAAMTADTTFAALAGPAACACCHRTATHPASNPDSHPAFPPAAT